MKNKYIPTKPKIIIISGNKSSGKDTTADYICGNYPNFKRIPLANKLKQFIAELFEFLFNKKFDWDYIEKNKNDIEFYIHGSTSTDDGNINIISYRKIMQFIGTDLLRKFYGDDIHCSGIHKDVFFEIINNKNNVIISDCRYKNEVDYFKNIYKCDVISLRVDGGFTNVVDDDHISEKLDFTCDYNIKNDKTLTNLYKKIDEIIHKIYFDQII